MEFTLFTIAVALAGTFLIAFMKGAFGGGFAIIGIPLLSLAMDPLTAGALLAPLPQATISRPWSGLAFRPRHGVHPQQPTTRDAAAQPDASAPAGPARARRR